MTLNQLIEQALKLKEQGYGELPVVLSCEYTASAIELVETSSEKFIDIGGY